MDTQEALETVADGHMVWTEARAQEVCAVFGVPPIKGHPMFSDPPGTFKGLTMAVEGEVCVTALALGHHIVAHLGLSNQVRGFNGRGSQGREHARVIAAHLLGVKTE